MSDENASISGILNFGPVSLELTIGDILLSTSDAFCCPVDSQCQSERGLFGVLLKRKAFSDEFLAEKRRLPFGSVLQVPVQGLAIPQVILISLINNQTGTVSRDSILTGLTEALNLSDRQGFKTLGIPFLGNALAKFDYGIGAELIVKAIRAFGNSHPQYLHCVRLFAFNSNAHAAFLKQYYSFEQSI